MENVPVSLVRWRWGLFYVIEPGRSHSSRFRTFVNRPEPPRQSAPLLSQEMLEPQDREAAYKAIINGTAVASRDFGTTSLDPVKRKRGRPKKRPPNKYRIYTECRVDRIEGIDVTPEAVEKLNRSERQALLDSVHTKEHTYWITGRYDSELVTVKVKGMLPMFAKIYVFSIGVEYRAYDDEGDSCRGRFFNPLKIEEASEARSIEPGSFRIDTQRTFTTSWPPTLCEIIELITSSSGMRLGKPLRFTPEKKLRDLDMKCTSVETLEEGTRQLGEVDHFLILIRAREYLLGPEYFELCRFFEPAALVNLTPDVFAVLQRRKLNTTQILRLFLQKDRTWPSIRDGASLVRFIDERLDSFETLSAVLPDFASRAGWRMSPQGATGAPTGGSPSNSKKPKARKEDAATLKHAAYDPHCRTTVAGWFDSLRSVYWNVVGSSYHQDGVEFNAHRVHSYERDFINYLIEREVVKAYDASDYDHKVSEISRRLAPLKSVRTHDGLVVYADAAIQHAKRVVKNTLDTIHAAYDKEVEDIVENAVRHSLSHNGMCHFTYAEEYNHLVSNCKSLDGSYPEDVRDRLKIVCQGRRSVLEPYEAPFVEAADWAAASLRNSLLKRDAIESPSHPFWETLLTRLTDQAEKWNPVVAEIRDRASRWMTAQGAPKDVYFEARRFAQSLVPTPFRIFDIPETNVCQRRPQGESLPDTFRAMARAISDRSFGPGEVNVSSAFSRASVLRPPNTEARGTPKKRVFIIGIFEAEKMTPTDIVEILYACMFRAKSERVLLWVFGDSHMLHLGGLDLLTTVPARRPTVTNLTYCVVESEIAGLYLKLTSGSLQRRAPISYDENAAQVISERLILSEDDVEVTTVDQIDEETGESTGCIPISVEEINIDTLPRLRSGELRPTIGKVSLLTLHDLRQVYTIAGYVRDALILVGSPETLKVLQARSMADFSVTECPDESQRGYSDRYRDCATGKLMRVLFSPKRLTSLVHSVVDRDIPNRPELQIV